MNTFLDQGLAIISGTPSATLDEGDAVDEVLSDASETRQGEVAVAQHGDRLDRALTHLAPEFSRNYLQQLIDAGWVQINGQVVRKHAHKVRAADVLTLELHPTPQSQAFKPQAMDLVVMYQDPHILVIDKPAGMVVHPAPGNWSGTLLNGLLALDEKMVAMPRAGIVHRLDKDTSGLMVVARTRQAMDALVAAIAVRSVSRQYLAVGHRTWSGKPSVCVDAPMGRDPRNRLRMAVVDLLKTPGKTAKTDIHFVANTVDGCLVRCVLHTGRTHQIRVHMASIGHPLVADKVYGGTDRYGMVRQALHAFRLAFDHPVTGAALAFESPVPADFEHLLKTWGLSYNSSTR
ncbi:MAG: RluA family pseudouridine synthase [Betaproteobacteria bacterium]